MRAPIALVFGLAASFLGSCTDRALDLPTDGGPDLRKVDLAGADLALFDLAGADFAGDMAGPRPNPCPAGARFIFTIDANGTLSRFNPANAQFFDVGPISCPAFGQDNTPNSMAIDRSGDGYVNYQQGDIFRLHTDSGACEPTSYSPGQFGIRNVGMSFAEDAPASSDETLWVSPTGVGQAELASIDVTTFDVSSPIDVKTASDNGELTGDDQANLWGFYPGALPPTFIARIDKKTGALDRRLTLPSLAADPQAWGFAAWQGGFYVFLMRQMDDSTSVYHVDGTTGDVTTAVSDTGRQIVGVGVATCAGDTSDGGAPIQ